VKTVRQKFDRESRWRCIWVDVGHVCVYVLIKKKCKSPYGKKETEELSTSSYLLIEKEIKRDTKKAFKKLLLLHHIYCISLSASLQKGKGVVKGQN
jgi:hypothetical protein